MATTCTKLIKPPEKVNGISVTSEYTGSVLNYTFGTYPFCFNSFNIPKESAWVGKRGPFSYTFKFSVPVNNLQLLIAATGGKITTEEFVITTDGGIPTIILDGGCQNTIISNRIISGSEEGTQGGFYTISAPSSYTSLTIKGQGGGAGSLLGICAASVPNLLENIPTYITTTLRPTTTPRPTTPYPEFFAKLGKDIIGEFIGDESGVTLSTNFAGDIVAIGAPFNNNSEGIRSGHTRIYNWNYELAEWSQLGLDIDGDSGGDRSGYTVSLNAAGDYVAIGAPYDSTFFEKNGQVRVYQWDGLNNWSQIGKTLYGNGGDIYFGTVTVLNSTGKILAVASGLNKNSTVKIYKLNGETWEQIGKTLEYLEDIKSMSLNERGDVLAVGIPSIGTVFTYYFDEYFFRWIELKHILQSQVGDNAGYSVSLNASGDILAVGVPLKDFTVFRTRFNISSGAVRIYKWSTAYERWILIGKDIDGDTYDDKLGISVSLNSTGDVLATGANIRIYNWNKSASTWVRRTLEDFNLENLYADVVALNYDGSRVFTGSTYSFNENFSKIDTSRSGDVKVYQIPKFVPPATTTTITTTPDPSLIIPTITFISTATTPRPVVNNCIPIPTSPQPAVNRPISPFLTTKSATPLRRSNISVDEILPFDGNIIEPTTTITTTTTTTTTIIITTTNKPNIYCIPDCNKLNY